MEVPWELANMSMILPAFALVLARISGLFIVAPILGSQVIPVRFRAAAAIALTMMVFPIVLPTIGVHLTLATAVPGLVGELLVGVTLGLGMSLLFVAMEFVGLMVAQQAGLALAQVFDPVMQSNGTPLGRLYFIAALFIFLFTGGLAAMVQALLDSFATMPLLGFTVDTSVLATLVDLLMASMVLAFRLAGPVLTALLLTSIAMGFVSRTMPQLNILAVGFSIRIFVAFVVVIATLGTIEPVISAFMWSAIQQLSDLFKPSP